MGDREDAFPQLGEQPGGRHLVLVNPEDDVGRAPSTCEPNRLCEPPKLVKSL